MSADLKKTNELLERLVRAAERLLNEAYGVRYGHTLTPPEDFNPDSKESVSYATDEETFKQQLTQAAKQFREAKNDDEKMVSYNEEGI